MLKLKQHIILVLALHFADKEIYLVTTTNKIQWGRRIYYFNYHRDSDDYSWFSDNLNTALNSPAADTITMDWLFKSKWHPNKNLL